MLIGVAAAGAAILIIIVVTFIVLDVKKMGKKHPKPDDKDADYYHKKFLDQVDPTRLRSGLEYYSSLPHIAGSVNDRDQAVYTEQQ